MPRAPQVICVTGGSGFLGSYCVKLLLQRGYRVHTTVRDPTNEKKVAHLKALPGAKERLTLFKADLLEEGAFDAAIKDCSVVLHTASPFFLDNQTRESLVEPAVQGALNVLRSAARTPSVRRAVLTSSGASVYVHFGTKPADHVFTEADWSHQELMEQSNFWYGLSKVMAEKSAWEFVNELKEPNFDLVTMCPTWILGPMLQPELNESSKAIYDYVCGNIQEIPRGDKAIVDVRDVAQAHIAAFENPQASGRYFLVGDSATEVEIAAMIKAVLPKAPVATKVADGEDALPLLFSCGKAEHELGLRFRSAEEMIHATCDGLVKHRFAS